MSRKDLLLNDNYDLLIKDGDFVIGDSDGQHADLITRSEKGSWKQSPWVGFGFFSGIKQRFTKQQFIRDLTIELENDGYENPTINIDPETNEFKIEL